jgi:predicted DNA-binding transcriptional regulator AlpA
MPVIPEIENPGEKLAVDQKDAKADEQFAATVPRYGDKKAVAAMLGMSRRTVDNLVAQGCPHLRIGARRLRFDMNEVRSWLTQQFHTQRRGKPSGATS